MKSALGTILVVSSFLSCTAAFAEGPAIVSVSAQVRDLKPDAVDEFGRKGCLIVRSSREWDDVRKRLAAIGPSVPAAEKPLPVDFAKEMLVCLFNLGEVSDKFSVRGYAVAAPQLDIVMSCPGSKERKKAFITFNTLLAVVPATHKLRVDVLTYHPMVEGPFSTPDKAELEWSHTFGPDAGDWVDALQAHIEAKDTQANAGGDVLVQFTLRLANAAVVKDGHFAGSVDSVSVWDGKYSKGYRNHAFDVTGPDGKTIRIRPAVITAWDKNAPHPEEIRKDEPYDLPDWTGETFRSLKGLGLDTSAAGTYTITGIYMEGPGTEGETPMWNGTMRSNTITIEVGKP